MQQRILTIAAILTALAVALGAFGAHGLKELVPPNSLLTYETGVRYHFYHAFGLFLTGILANSYPTKQKTWLRTAWLFGLGILLFSGSLYTMVFAKSAGLTLNWLGAITPLGGVCFILGWLGIAAGLRK